MMQPAPQMYTAPGLPAASKAMFLTKLILRIASMILSICIIAIISSTLQSSLVGLSYVVVTVPPAGIALCWSFAEFVTLLAKTGRRGIHPGAIVGVDLVLWLGMVVSLAFDLIFDINGPGYWGYSGYIYSSGRSSSGSTYTTYRRPTVSGSLLSELIRKGEATLALLIMLLALHFTLFVIGCVETARRNQMEAPPMYVVMAPQTYPMQQPYTMQQSMQTMPPTYYQYPVAGVAPPPPVHVGPAPRQDHHNPEEQKP